MPATAAQKQKVGHYDVHYSAFASTFLTPEVAKTYDIARSRYVGVINVTVMDIARGDEGEAIAVTLSGNAKNLIGSLKKLNFKEVRVGDSIYYLAEVNHRNEETFTFDINLDNGDDLQAAISFKQKFYVDE
jgi:hypothetical protein